MLTFQPKSDKEIDERQLLPRGEYAFEIIEATEATSQAGNPMIEMRVRIIKNGFDRILPDYVLPLRPAKWRNVCIACGVHDKYLAGSVTDDDLLGKRGKARVGVERAKRGFPARNVIVDYLF
jgi:hypothetical protein